MKLTEWDLKIINGLNTETQFVCSIKSVSKSRMTRKMDFYVISENRLLRITHLIAKILDWGMDKNSYLIVHGCGMDMVYHTLYSFAHHLDKEYNVKISKGNYTIV